MAPMVSGDHHALGPYNLWTLRDVVGLNPEPFSDGLLTPFGGYGMEPRFWEDLEYQFKMTMGNRLESRMTNPSNNGLPITEIYYREALSLLCWDLGPSPRLRANTDSEQLPLRKKRRIQTRSSKGTSKGTNVTFNTHASQIEIEAKDAEARIHFL